jgi:tetratricopeptide (TPR) repeat protein
MSYLDFELEIGIGQGREYPVRVVRSPAGEARETMYFPFDKLALENQLLALQNALLRSGSRRRQILMPEEQTVQNFGQSLFNAPFTGEVRNRYAVSQLAAFNQGEGLRLKLRILPPELAALPWEFLYDTSQPEFVCLSSDTPIVRYLELPHPPPPLTVTPPLSILSMIANPKGLADLDVEQEKQRVEKAIEQLCTNGLIKLTWLPSSTWQALQRAMRSGPWHIFHFIGHGGFDTIADEGLLALENEEGGAQILRATHLGRLLAGHRSLRLIILNSCEGARGSERAIFSSTAAVLVQRGIPAVLAMQYEITDQAAIEFSRTFYEALADGLPVDAAVCDARKAVSVGIENTVEWGIPVLYMRSPNGVLFTTKHEPTSSIDQLPPSAIPPRGPFAPHQLAQPLQKASSTVEPPEQNQSISSADASDHPKEAKPLPDEEVQTSITIITSHQPSQQIDTPDKNSDIPEVGGETEKFLQEARILREQGHLDEAIAIYDTALQLDQNEPLIWQEYGQVELQRSQFKEALEAFERALQLDPKKSESWSGKGNALHNLGQLKAALDAYVQACSYNRTLALAWYGKGSVLYDLGRNKEALQAFQEVVNLDKNYAPAYYYMGEVLSAHRELSGALDMFDQAISCDPKLVKAWIGRGNVLDEQGRLTDALDSYEQALRIDPFFAPTWSSKATELRKLKRYPEALNAYGQALKLNPNFSQAWNGRGNTFYNLGNYSAALLAYDRALQLNPRMPSVWHNKSLASTVWAVTTHRCGPSRRPFACIPMTLTSGRSKPMPLMACTSTKRHAPPKTKPS